jgi:hypothetical protein
MILPISSSQLARIAGGTSSVCLVYLNLDKHLSIIKMLRDSIPGKEWEVRMTWSYIVRRVAS